MITNSGAKAPDTQIVMPVAIKTSESSLLPNWHSSWASSFVLRWHLETLNFWKRLRTSFASLIMWQVTERFLRGSFKRGVHSRRRGYVLDPPKQQYILLLQLTCNADRLTMETTKPRPHGSLQWNQTRHDQSGDQNLHPHLVLSSQGEVADKELFLLYHFS